MRNRQDLLLQDLSGALITKREGLRDESGEEAYHLTAKQVKIYTVRKEQPY